jgi:hypothetical protein
MQLCVASRSPDGVIVLEGAGNREFNTIDEVVRSHDSVIVSPCPSALYMSK